MEIKHWFIMYMIFYSRWLANYIIKHLKHLTSDKRLKKLSKEIDEILEHETNESLTNWLNEHRGQPKIKEK